MKKVNTNEFNEEITSGVVLTDFYADWCGPCKMMAPVLEQIDKSIDALKVLKVNVDEEPELAMKYGIQSIPNLIIFKDGKAVDQIIGFQPKQALVAKVEQYL
ncbi:MAG: thioredoxin [Erysipelotrichaceae bacterium]|nr:thioredoxin [Erysipelotrichaceae bacterium]